MTAIESLQSRLKAGEVIIMDGGMGTEIGRRGVPMGKRTWSGEPILTHPDTIREIHEDYIRAGAEIIITNTFSTSRAKLGRGGLGDRTDEINRLAVKLAREARENIASDNAVVIAGSMSTFIPALDPRVIPSYAAALADYREQAQTLADAGVDLIVGEMLIRTLDARAFLEASAETGLPVWVGYSCQDDGGQQYLGLHGRVGKESIRDAVEAVASKRVTAMFIMHSFPEDTGPGLRDMIECTDLPVGAYAHGEIRATTEEIEEFSKDMSKATLRYDQGLSPEEYLRHAREWVRLGARIIGGCCGTTPEHVKALKEGLG